MPLLESLKAQAQADDRTLHNYLLIQLRGCVKPPATFRGDHIDLHITREEERKLAWPSSDSYNDSLEDVDRFNERKGGGIW